MQENRSPPVDEQPTVHYCSALGGDFADPTRSLSLNNAKLRRTRTLVLRNALVAELVDAPDLKSGVPNGACGFKSRPGYLKH